MKFTEEYVMYSEVCFGQKIISNGLTHGFATVSLNQKIIHAGETVPGVAISKKEYANRLLGPITIDFLSLKTVKL